MTDMFYRTFEDRHRGSFELIKSRLQIYLPFIQPLKTLYNIPNVLDLGCGRGEWIELLQENGFKAQGVDLDAGMLETCRTRGLDVIQNNALEYIKGLDDNSLCVVSAFHFVEHIPFDALQQFINDAHRVLKPGGLLILETPNPENLLVGTSSFYLDPTHQRPLPSELLAFVVEYAQFNRVKTLFLQEPATRESELGLQDILEGVSPDYAVVSQKKTEPETHSLFDTPFAREYGNRLMSLARRYDQQIGTLIQKWKITQQKLDSLDQVHHYQQELQAVYASKSWRLTWPLRKAMRLTRRLLTALRSRLNSIKTESELTQPTAQLALRATRIYHALRSAIEKKE